MRDIEVVWTFMLDYMRGWGIREHSHDFYQMYYVVSGEADMLLDRQKVHLYPHLCVVIEPGSFRRLIWAAWQLENCSRKKTRRPLR